MMKEKEKLEEQISQICEMLDEILDDRGVPRNIRAAVDNAKQKLSNKEAGITEFSAAIYDLDDVSNDINMPNHTRTMLWEIISEIESLKEAVKK